MPNPVQTTWLQPGLYPVEPIPYTPNEEPASTQTTTPKKDDSFHFFTRVPLANPDGSYTGGYRTVIYPEEEIKNPYGRYIPGGKRRKVINEVASLVLPSYRPTVRTGIAPTPTFMENPLSTAAIDAQVAKGIAEIKQAPNLKAIEAAKNALLNMLKKTGKGGKNSHEAMLVKTAATDASTIIRDNQAAARAASEASARTTGYVPKEYRPWTFKEQVLHGNGEIPTAYIEGGLKFH